MDKFIVLNNINDVKEMIKNSNSTIIIVDKSNGDGILNDCDLANVKNTFNLQRIKRNILAILSDLGMSPKLKGFQYIEDSLFLMDTEKDYTNVTKHIYPTVAKDFNTSSDSVERAIRYAIEIAFSNGNIDLLYDTFDGLIKDGDRPSNSLFLKVVLNKLKSIA